MWDRIQSAGSTAWALVGIIVLVVCVGVVASYVRVIWLPLILAGAIVFLLNPIVSWLSEKRIPRMAGTAFTYVGFGAAVTFLVVLVIPFASDQVDQFNEDWPENRAELEAWVDDLSERSNEDNWPVKIPHYSEIQDAVFGTTTVDDPAPGSGDTADDDAAEAAAATEEFRETIETAREVGARVFEFALIALLAPILAFYILVDLPHIRRVAESLVPGGAKVEAFLLAGQLNRAIGGYFRGQLVVAALVGVMVSFGLWLIGLPFWLVIGMVAGLFNMVPLIGPWVGSVPGIMIALTTRDVQTAIWVGVVMFVAQQIDNHFISPLVMQRTVHLHPVVVMMALLSGGTIFGFVGLLLAVPIVATIKILSTHLWRTYVLGEPVDVIGGEWPATSPPSVTPLSSL